MTDITKIMPNHRVFNIFPKNIFWKRVPLYIKRFFSKRKRHLLSKPRYIVGGEPPITVILDISPLLVLLNDYE